MTTPRPHPSITDRVLAELREGPATLRELRTLLPDLNAQQINGALHALARSGRIRATEQRVHADAGGRPPRIYELPGLEQAAS